MIETLVTKPFEYVKEQMVSAVMLRCFTISAQQSPQRAGVAPPSLAHHLLSEYDKGDIDHQIKWAVGSLYGGTSLLRASLKSTLIYFFSWR